jgi:subtilisin-like proprotein convertase family protein
MSKRTLTTLSILGLLLGFGACATDEDLQKDDTGEEGKTDAWDYTNAPSRFQVQFEYRLASLPRSGEAQQIPWADDYWAYYRDSINYRWRGQDHLSPAELYDAAFNRWTPPAGYMDLTPQTGDLDQWDAAYYQQLGPLAMDVHRRRGNEQATNGRDDDGDGRIDETDDNDGIESWWGICHAWAPAAVMEPEPIRTVTHNGQTFTPSDIKGLMMIAYDSTNAVMLGGRCNEKEVARDENGRATDPECQDVNAGAFHVVIANMLGRYRRAFDEDRTYDYQVWNQPIRSFEVTSLREGLTAAQANTVLGRTGSTYQPNRDAVSFAEVRANVRYITEAHPSEQPSLPNIDRYTRTDSYHYVLELDRNGNIIGGEWASDSQSNHPDFLWLPLRNGTGFRNISYANVRMLLDMSRRDDSGGGGSGEGQRFTVEPRLAIPDNNSTGITSTLTVPATGSITGLQVAVDITHTYIGDLTVRLRRAGREVVLHRQQGGSTDDLRQSFTVTDFNGQDISGAWDLVVTDDAAQDTGTLNSWGLVAVIGGGGGGGGGTGGSRTYTSTGTVNIPDNNATGAGSTINVTDSGNIRGLRARVNIQHTYIGDLVVELRHNGQTRTLHNRTGGGTDNIETEYQIPEFNSTAITGAWELRVMDRARRDTGRIVQWQLFADLN